MTLSLHEHPFASYCWKPLIALYERDVLFTRAQVDADHAPLAELWPVASIPVLVDDAAGGHAGRVIGHRRVPRSVRRGTPTRSRSRGRGVADAAVGPGHRRPRPTRPHLRGTRRASARHRWLSGPSFTLADCAAAPALFYTRAVSRWDERRLADLTRYYAALVARPAVARVIEEARPFRALFPLPWPDDID